MQTLSNGKAMTEDWTKITPEQIESIGFVDLTTDDRDYLAVWEYRKPLPPHVEYIRMNYLATHWELSFCSDIDGEGYVDIKTEEEFNSWMEYLDVDIRL